MFQPRVLINGVWAVDCVGQLMVSQVPVSWIRLPLLTLILRLQMVSILTPQHVIHLLAELIYSTPTFNMNQTKAGRH